MKKMLILLICISFLQITKAQINFSQRLMPSSTDLYIDNFSGSSTSPDEIDYCSGQWTIGGIPTAYRTFLMFDFSTIPAGSVINSATLNFSLNAGYHFSSDNSRKTRQRNSTVT